MKRILSLGAGVQSSALLLMSCRGELPKLDAAVFADTQWEPAEVYEWMENVLRPEAEAAGIPIHVVTAGNIRADAVVSEVRATVDTGKRWASLPYRTRNQDGSVGMLRRQCTSEYKIAPLARRLKLLAGLKPRRRLPTEPVVEKWLGISIDEAHRAKPPRPADRWLSHRFPLLDMRINRQACIAWLDRNGFPDAPRSACIGCPYKSPDEWRHLRDSSPAEWADAVTFDHAIRNTGGKAGQLFVYRQAVPLDEADLSTEYDHGQLALFGDWGNECEGMCGV